MIKVYWQGRDLIIEGHAKRDTCAAVSAAVQTACLTAASMQLVDGALADKMADHGGLAVIHTDRLRGDGEKIITALLSILEAQAEAWPGEIEMYKK